MPGPGSPPLRRSECPGVVLDMQPGALVLAHYRTSQLRLWCRFAFFFLRLPSLIIVMRPATLLGLRGGTVVRSPVVVWQLLPTDQPDVIHAQPICSISGVVQGLGVVGKVSLDVVCRRVHI
jgi:hypothetical protein